MGFFDSVTDLIGWSNSNAEDHADSARLNLGNIFLPGGLRGGKMLETPGGAAGFGGTPLNEADWTELNRVYGAVNDANSFSDINWNAGNFRGTEFAGNKFSPEAQKFLQNNWGTIRGAKQLGDVDWSRAVGSPGYAQPAGAPGAPTSTLGDLEPARGMFANLAASQGAEVGANNQGAILDLLRRQAQPFEQQAQNRLNNNLFMRGRLGTEDSATGEAFRSFSRGLAEADTQRQVAAMGLSDQLRTSALGRSLNAAQGASALTTLSTLPFDMALKLATARSQSALGQANSAAYQNDNIMDSWSKFWSFGGAMK